MKVTVSLFLGLLLLISVVGAQEPDPIVGAETSVSIGSFDGVTAPIPEFLDLVGVTEQFGTTWYDYQHNGSMSRMIAYGPDGYIHCCWTNGLVSGAADRVVYYNSRAPGGTWTYGSTGTQVNTTTRCGYCTLALDGAGNPIIAYHGYNTGSTTNLIYVYYNGAEHQCPGYPPGVTDLAWPHVTIDRNGNIHVVCRNINIPGR